jgi:hypothetical protein
MTGNKGLYNPLFPVRKRSTPTFPKAQRRADQVCLASFRQILSQSQCVLKLSGRSVDYLCPLSPVQEESL